MSRLETESRRVLEKLIATERILSLSTDDKVATARFVALQLVRTRKQREMSSCLERELFEKIKKMHPDFDEAVLDGKDVEANSRISSLRMLLSFDEFTPHIYNKDFVLFKAPEGHKFYISDSPVVLNNRKSFGPYGNLGLAVPGIEIYMPLSSTLCMGLLSQTIRKDMLEALSEFSMLSVVAINSYAEATKEARRFMDAFSGQGAYVCSAENVMFLNSLQASFSARYVFCEENKFELVERMLKDDPSMKNGLLPSVM